MTSEHQEEIRIKICAQMEINNRITFVRDTSKNKRIQKFLNTQMQELLDAKTSMSVCIHQRIGTVTEKVRSYD